MNILFGQNNQRIYLVLLSFLFCNDLLLAQCSITSSTGYQVDVNVVPRSIVAPSSCPYGYNYNVIIDYTVTYSGSGAPGSMYTLQGNLTCVSQSLFYNLPNSGGTGSYTTSANPYRNTADCASATPASLGCNSSSLQIEGPGISNRTITCTGSALPIELIEFKTIKTVNEVLVKWVTASEINNDYFTIERSNDGQNWKIIGTISGAGNSNQNNEYTYIDRNPLKGNSYYQLRQTDYDGTTTYSHISSVDENKNGSDIVLELYPNPSENMITIEGEENALNEILIYSMLGKDFTAQIQFSTISPTMLQCDISTVPNGVYFIQSKGGTKRFVKI